MAYADPRQARKAAAKRLPPPDPKPKAKPKTGATGDPYTKQGQSLSATGDNNKSQYDKDKAPKKGAYWNADEQWVIPKGKKGKRGKPYIPPRGLNKRKV